MARWVSWHAPSCWTASRLPRSHAGLGRAGGGGARDCHVSLAGTPMQHFHMSACTSAPHHAANPSCGAAAWPATQLPLAPARRLLQELPPESGRVLRRVLLSTANAQFEAGGVDCSWFAEACCAAAYPPRRLPRSCTARALPADALPRPPPPTALQRRATAPSAWRSAACCASCAWLRRCPKPSSSTAWSSCCGM